jgi:hypothetical protein
VTLRHWSVRPLERVGDLRGNLNRSKTLVFELGNSDESARESCCWLFHRRMRDIASQPHSRELMGDSMGGRRHDWTQPFGPTEDALRIPLLKRNSMKIGFGFRNISDCNNTVSTLCVSKWAFLARTMPAWILLPEPCGRFIHEGVTGLLGQNRINRPGRCVTLGS